MSTAWGDGTRVGVRPTCSRQSAEPLLWLRGRAGARLKPRTGDGRRRPAGGDADALIAPGLVRFPSPRPKGPPSAFIKEPVRHPPAVLHTWRGGAGGEADRGRGRHR